MDERLQFVAELCREFGIFRKTGYKRIGSPLRARASGSADPLVLSGEDLFRRSRAPGYNPEILPGT